MRSLISIHFFKIQITHMSRTTILLAFALHFVAKVSHKRIHTIHNSEANAFRK